MLTEEAPVVPAKRLKKRTVIATILVSVVVVLLALWAVDTWARQQVANYVGDKVRELLSLESSEPVNVEIAGVSIIAQVLTGELEQVNVDVDDVTIGDFTGGVELRAEGIPVDLKKPVDSVQIELTVGEQSIQQIAHVLSAAAIDEVTIVEPEIQFSSEFSIFGFSLDVGVGIEPYAKDGEIGFTPTSVILNGERSSAAELSEQFGSFAADLLQTRTVCVAKWLPEALTLDDVEVRDDELIITIGADKAILDEAALSTLGACPGQ
jgi:hypothetical protein